MTKSCQLTNALPTQEALHPDPGSQSFIGVTGQFLGSHSRDESRKQFMCAEASGLSQREMGCSSCTPCVLGQEFAARNRLAWARFLNEGSVPNPAHNAAPERSMPGMEVHSLFAFFCYHMAFATDRLIKLRHLKPVKLRHIHPFRLFMK